MRISDWSSDVCSSDLGRRSLDRPRRFPRRRQDRRRAAQPRPRSDPGQDAGARERGAGSHRAGILRCRRRAASAGLSVMWKVTWRNLLARKVRLALSGFAIVLGVAFAAGTLIFTDTLGGHVDDISECPPPHTP